MKAKEQNLRRISFSSNCALNHKHVLMKVIQNNRFKMCFFLNIQQFTLSFPWSERWRSMYNLVSSQIISVDKDQNSP